MAITTTTTLPAPVQQSFSNKLLSVKTPNFIHKVPAEKKMMPANGGRTLRMRRYNPLPSSLVPLGNSGITPPATQLTAVDIDATISFYGQYVQLNEQVTLQSQDPVLNQAVMRLGVALRQTEDELMRDMMASTASSVDCVNGTNGDRPTELSNVDLMGVIRTLFNNDAHTVLDNIEGEDRFGTGPVRNSFLALCSTQLTADLEERVAGFRPVAEYASQEGILRSEYGTFKNLRFLVSSIGSVTPNASNLNRNVYNIFCMGMEAVAAVEQDRYSAQFIYRPPIFDGPLALNASVGYKFAEVPRILNDEWIINLRATLFNA
jgi:N4-gp56 family major capsid protein